MSVIVVGKFNADPQRLEAVFAAREKDVLAVSQDSKSQGALHHCFADADGKVLVVDEWESAEAFQRFFAAQSAIPGLMQEVGVQGAPEFSFYPVVQTPGQF